MYVSNERIKPRVLFVPVNFSIASFTLASNNTCRFLSLSPHDLLFVFGPSNENGKRKSTIIALREMTQ